MVDLSDFKVSNYPDGHRHIKSDLDLKGDETLTASIRSFDDLFLIAQIKRIHPELTRLSIKYLLAGRCDRRFSPGEAIDLEIVCDFVNRLGFEGVSVLKPHSRKTLDLLKNSSEWDVYFKLIRECHLDIQNKNSVCYISPDAGAATWINNLNVKPMIQCSKKRDAAGTVTGIEFVRYSMFSGETVDSFEKHASCENFIIIDDLCDGGATFIAIAKAIHSRAPHAKVYLIVTHAIFSKGFTPFEGHIERIYCTNSFAKFEHPIVRQFTL